MDYAAYEGGSRHRNARRGQVDRVYVQVHDRGIAPAANITVELLTRTRPRPAFVPRISGPRFGTTPPTRRVNRSGTASHPIALSPTEPAMLESDSEHAATARAHLPARRSWTGASKFRSRLKQDVDVDGSFPNGRRVGLKNLHIVDAPAEPRHIMMPRSFRPGRWAEQIRIAPVNITWMERSTQCTKVVLEQATKRSEAKKPWSSAR